jgi:hypothetical protein
MESNGRFNELYQIAGETRADVKNIWHIVSEIKDIIKDQDCRINKNSQDISAIKITAGTIGAIISFLVSTTFMVIRMFL